MISKILRKECPNNLFYIRAMIHGNKLHKPCPNEYKPLRESSAWHEFT